MLSLFKLFLLFVGLASAGTAIGIPLALKSQGKLESGVGNIVQVGQSRGGTTPLSISGCKDTAVEGREEIDFGAPGSSFCWKVSDLESEGNQLSPISDSLTELFKKMWSQNYKNWNSEGHRDWRVVCIQEGNGWLAKHLGDGEYLGYCSSSRLEKDSRKTSFLEIDKKDSRVAKINICQSDCWKGVNDENIKNLSSKEIQSWMKIEFYGN